MHVVVHDWQQLTICPLNAPGIVNLEKCLEACIHVGRYIQELCRCRRVQTGQEGGNLGYFGVTVAQGGEELADRQPDVYRIDGLEELAELGVLIEKVQACGSV